MASPVPSSTEIMMTHLKLFALSVFFMLLMTACGDGIDESQVAARVGDEILLKHDVRLHIPFGMTGADSLTFAQEYVSKWVDEQMLYQQARKNLPNFKELEDQAQQYKYDLICQTYLVELMKSREEAVPDSLCQKYYQEYGRQLTLESPIVKGFVMQVPARNSRIKTVKNWLTEILDGKMDHVEELEQFCQQKCPYYDGFLESWSDLHRMSDRLPVVVVDERDFLRIGVHQIDEDDFSYLYVICDYRLTGEPRPYESALPDIQEMLQLQRRKDLRQRLMDELRSDAIERGSIFLRE